ncbi:MAG: trypsin-like peptidase domain-containing protein [Ruminococcus sp.]|nr:trypsin-like peptidase domain-containing protein [Ruminococcus sp.]
MDERDNNITSSISDSGEAESKQDYSEAPDSGAKPEESIDQPVYISRPEHTTYDSFMYESIGLEEMKNIGNDSQPNGEEAAVKKSSGTTAAVVLFLVLMAAAFGFAAFGIVSDMMNSEKALEKLANRKQIVLYRETNRKVSADELIKPDKNGKYSIEGVAELVKPSIVEIYTYQNRADYNAGANCGSGSGVVISEDGYIVTNTHVLYENGVHIINTVDGKSYEAEVVGRDVKTDIAVIKVNSVKLQPAVFGNSDDAVVGEQVVAIGNPVSLSFTVTDGIISAVHRMIRTDETSFEMECIQTNADISPGNSGGALVNMYGEVVGITSSKYVSSSYEGLGFAITSNEALPIIEELIDHGYIKGRFRIGIQLIDMSDKSKKLLIEEELGYTIPENFYGIYIDSISEDSDIKNTALKPGDFITEVAGIKVRTYNEFYTAITNNYGVGDTVPASCAHIDKDGTITDYDIKFKLIEDTSGNY